MHSRSACRVYIKNALRLPGPAYLTYHLAVSQKINTLQFNNNIPCTLREAQRARKFRQFDSFGLQ